MSEIHVPVSFGELLDKMIRAIDLDRQRVYIANVVKCRPPENRVPTEDEARACRPLLARQFNLVKPKVIVLLGATAFKYFTGSTEGISKVRGQWIEKNGYLILPTFHPAFILRNNRERIRLWEDIGLVRGKLEELGQRTQELELRATEASAAGRFSGCVQSR